MFVKFEHGSFLRNPLARCSYAFLYILVAVEFITGFAMYYMVNPNTVQGTLSGYVLTVCGGEMMVHLIHHYAAWAIILFAVGHLYMVIRAEFMEGESEVSSMFSGYKFLIHNPKDATDSDQSGEKHLI
jgi:Ni/Fe-hydrogenase 1 B-type cytochrome subunit